MVTPVAGRPTLATPLLTTTFKNHWNYYYLFIIITSQLNSFILTVYKAEMESRAQDSRPRTPKKSEAKDSPTEDRLSPGQGQESSRPRIEDTSASAFKKKGLQKIFSSDLQKKTFSNTFFRRSTNF